MSHQSYDVIVIGAGPAGEVAAGRLAAGGRRVALVEAELVGGECSYYACMPSKALLRPAQALAEARRVPAARGATSGQLDVAAALARRDEVIHNLDDSVQVPWLTDRGVTLIRGRGRLDGERRVRVAEQELLAHDAVVLAVGSGPAMPPIPGLDQARPWTNREATTAHAIPGRLLVLGGGVVGVEMGHAYATLGASVTLIEAADRLIAREEPFASRELHEALVELGVDVRMGVAARAVRREGRDVTVELSDGASVQGDEILVGVGRRPRTEDVGLETVGLQPGREVEVDDRMRVPGMPWLFAIGDANGRALLTHMGKYQAHVASEVISGRDARVRDDAGGVPRVVFTEPQVAAVGLTLAGAQEHGLNARAVDVPSSSTAGASFHGRDAPGTARLVVDEDRGVIVGATFTGVDVAEWLHGATIAIVGEVPIERLWDAVACFPTRSEVWLKLLEAREEAIAAERADATPPGTRGGRS